MAVFQKRKILANPAQTRQSQEDASKEFRKGTFYTNKTIGRY